MSIYSKLARQTIKHYFKNQKVLPLPSWLPQKLLKIKRAAFVSLHLNGRLRGCIGTIEPVQENLAREIIINALSAAFRDPRFPPLTPEELAGSDISVDILSKLKKIEDLNSHDPKKYGLVVKTEDGRSGLLLPNLPGIETAQEQLKVTCQKAGIRPGEKKGLYRFTTKRYREN